MGVKKNTQVKYLYFKNHIFVYIPAISQVNVLIVELKSEALKERHWKQLMKRLNVNWVLSELTLGNIWDIDFGRHELTIRDVISVAQGEMALEEFLKQVSVHNFYNKSRYDVTNSRPTMSQCYDVPVNTRIHFNILKTLWCITPSLFFKNKIN